MSSDLGDSLLFCRTLSLPCFPLLTNFPKHTCPVVSSPPEIEPFSRCQSLFHTLSSPSIQFPRNQSFQLPLLRVVLIIFHSSVNFSFWGYFICGSAIARPPDPSPLFHVFYLILCSSMMWSGVDPVRPGSLLFSCNVI